jgi:hypothetical protein
MTETRSTLRAWLDWQRTPILAAAFAGSVLPRARAWCSAVPM